MAFRVQVKLEGDYKALVRGLADARHLRRHFDGALGAVARAGAKAIRDDIRAGTTGVSPLKRMTIKRRQFGPPLGSPEPAGHGSTPLVSTGRLVGAIRARKVGTNDYAVEIPAGARDWRGRALQERLGLLEEGTKAPIVITITPRMRRYLFALFRSAGFAVRRRASRGVLMIHIRPRPAASRAAEQFQDKHALRIFNNALAARLPMTTKRALGIFRI